MAILSSSVSVTHLKIVGELPGNARLFDVFSEALQRHAFNPIDKTIDEISVGWVHTEDMRDFSFASPDAFWRDDYLMFSLRTDVRKIPGVLLRSEVKKAEAEWLERNALRKVPKFEREDIKERVKGKLLEKAFPVPSTVDLLWNTKTGRVSVSTTSAKVLERVIDMFNKTFEDQRLVAVSPYAWGRALPYREVNLDEMLVKENKATSDTVLAEINDNSWIGEDFLKWMLYRTCGGSCEYVGLLPSDNRIEGESFVAYMDKRIVLVGASESGKQKVVASGPQNKYEEARTALKSGKRISEASLYFEKDEMTWGLTLKGDMFQFGSYKSPVVKVETGPDDDERAEREAFFFEKVSSIEQGYDMFDSLYTQFLEDRLVNWSRIEAEIHEWVFQGQE